MVTVAFDTATDRLSAAVRRGNRPVVEEALAGARQHARSLLPILERLLAQVDATVGDITTVALSDGPGSFTGLRVGAAVAKALAAAGSVHLFAASTLLVQAATVRGRGTVLSLSPALRGELYSALYRLDLPALRVEVVVPPLARTPDGLREAIGDIPDLVVSTAGDDLTARLVDVLGVPVVTGAAAFPRAGALLGLVGVDGGATAIGDPPGWEPDYGRPAEAQARWEQTHGRPLPDPAGTSH